jgi:CBS domain-containing protein
MNHEQALPTRRLRSGTTLAPAQPAASPMVTRDSVALLVMTDLTQVKAATIASGASLRQAERAMIHQGVRMLFVVNDVPAVEGLVTTTDLSDDKHMRLVQQRGLGYDDLCVADVMTPLAMLDAIDHRRMTTATVGNVIATLQRYGRNHLLVVEGADDATPGRGRGVLSRAQIERQLGTPIEVSEHANTFAEIVRMVA